MYYDFNHFDEYILEEDIESEGNVKCVFTKSLRREKMWNYFKYLNGKKIGIHELAWKFVVTERTIQNDIKFLVDNGYIRNTTEKLNEKIKEVEMYLDDQKRHEDLENRKNDLISRMTDDEYDDLLMQLLEERKERKRKKEEDMEM